MNSRCKTLKGGGGKKSSGDHAMIPRWMISRHKKREWIKLVVVEGKKRKESHKNPREEKSAWTKGAP